MADETKFTKRDREFIITLANNIQKLRSDFDAFAKASAGQQKQQPQPRARRGKSTPAIHAEFYHTDDKDLQMSQYIFIESLDELLRDMCKQNGIAYLSIEIDGRDVV